MQFFDDLGKPIGNVGVHVGYGPRCVVTDAAEDRQGRVVWEGRMGGTHGVNHASQAEQVGAMVNSFAAGLLGRHVLGRARDIAAVRNARIIDCPGQPEIGDLDAFDAVLQKDVGGLDVTVDQPGRGQRRAPRPPASRSAGSP